MLLLTAEAHDDAVMEVVLVGTTGLVAADAAAAQSGSESPPFQIPSQQTGRNRKSENPPSHPLVCDSLPDGFEDPECQMLSARLDGPAPRHAENLDSLSS